MVPTIGFFLLFMCCVCCIYGTISGVAAALLRHRRLYRSSRMAMSVTCVMSLIACVMMWMALYNRDFSLYYVLKNSSTDLPAFYTFTAFWSSLEGSHMLWTFFLTVCGTLCMWTYAKDNEHIMPYVGAAIMIVLAWMYYLAITHSDLFAVSPAPQQEGRGMNALLQNPYMAIHPPMLFIGYTALAVPFAYSIAALCYGDITEGWLKTVRRWTLIAWAFLTASIVLGGRWAYVELGWAGYWAWDPVENSSFMPWLFSTALLHSLLVQGQLGQLKRLTMVLAVFAFFFSFFGTFITRSGLITSVHSFAESPIGPNYLLFLAVMLFACSLLYGFRAHAVLPSETDKVWGVSKESALVVTLFLVLAFAAIVFVGTIFPIVTEWATDRRISVQAPYFNAFAPFIGLALVLSIAVGNLMTYRSSKMPHARLIILGSLVVSLPITAFLIWQGNVMETRKTSALVMQIVGLYLCGWAMSCLVWEMMMRLRRFQGKILFFFRRNMAYTGATIAHVGLMIMIIGFLGNLRGLEREVSLKAGESKNVFGYDFKMESKIKVRTEENVRLYEAPLAVTRDGRDVAKMYPARSQYPTSTDLLNEIAVEGNMWRDIYIVLRSFDNESLERVTLQININPTVRFVWLATFIMVIGGMLAAFDPYRGDRTRDVVAGQWETAS